MNITIDQDSISKRVRVRRGKNRRARNATMAATNAPSRPSTGHSWVVSARDQTSTRAASARHRISMDRVLRTIYLNRAAAETAPLPLTVGTFNSWSARFTSGSRCSSGASAGTGTLGGLGSRSNSMSGAMPR
jgi:hypothetical protein